MVLASPAARVARPAAAAGRPGLAPVPLMQRRIASLRCRDASAPAQAQAAQSKAEALAALEAFAAQNKQAIADATQRLSQAAAAAAAPAAGAPSAQGGLVELTADNFWEALESSGDKLTVVDFYTDNCGPCKLVYPELVKFNEELQARGGQIVKVNCSKANAALGKEVNVKVVPTFQLYRGREKVAEMTGVKMDKLRELVEANL